MAPRAATLFIEGWKRVQARLRVRWGMTKFITKVRSRAPRCVAPRRSDRRTGPPLRRNKRVPNSKPKTAARTPSTAR
jgi:hypothetical protein